MLSCLTGSPRKPSVPWRPLPAVAAAATVLLVGVAGAPASAVTLVGFDFENATAGDSTAAASSEGPGISGAVFGGSKFDSEVLLAGSDLVYRSAALLIPSDNGGLFNFFSFTTAATYDLISLSFAAGQNDTTPGTRDFDVLLSPVDAPAPATGDQANSLSGYSLLSTIPVPFGFAAEVPPNFTIDLTGTTLTPGTYHIAFAVSVPAQFTTATTQLFVDDVVLTPEPGTAVLLAAGLAGLASRRRRLH